jgi:hypothetical protein
VNAKEPHPIVFNNTFQTWHLRYYENGARAETAQSHGRRVSEVRGETRRTGSDGSGLPAGVTDRLFDVAALVTLWESYEQRRAERAA